MNGAHERDAGLQSERTVLAWQRTALSAAGLAVIVARVISGVASVAAAIVASLAALVAAIMAGLVAVERSRRLRAHALDAGAMASSEAKTIVGSVLVIAVLSLLVGVFGHAGFVVR